MNCYDLALEFLRTVTAIDELVDKKAKASEKEDKTHILSYLIREDYMNLNFEIIIIENYD